MIKYIMCFVIWMIIWAAVSFVYNIFEGGYPGYKEAAFVLVGWFYGAFVAGFLSSRDV